MGHLAKRFGISDKGLAKICNRFDIPRPRQGHWGKLAAGKPVEAIALPPASPHLDPSIRISSSVQRDPIEPEARAVGRCPWRDKDDPRRRTARASTSHYRWLDRPARARNQEAGEDLRSPAKALHGTDTIRRTGAPTPLSARRVVQGTGGPPDNSRGKRTARTSCNIGPREDRIPTSRQTPASAPAPHSRQTAMALCERQRLQAQTGGNRRTDLRNQELASRRSVTQLAGRPEGHG